MTTRPLLARLSFAPDSLLRQSVMAVLSAFLLILSFPPFEYSSLAWVALAPLLFVIARGVTVRRAFWLGWLAGIEFTFFAENWIAHSMTHFGQMLTLLAYAVAFRAVRDVLVLDEIFAVGDAGFRLRCEARYQELHRAGHTMVIVSHDPRVITTFCNRAILLDGGRIVAEGSGSEIAERYLSAREFADDLRRCLEDRPIRARPPGLSQKATRWVRRHQGLVRGFVALLALAVVILAGGLFVVWRAKEDATEAKTFEQNAGHAARRAQRASDETREHEQLADKVLGRLEEMLREVHQTNLALASRT